jgi:hypothetical protein
MKSSWFLVVACAVFAVGCSRGQTESAGTANEKAENKASSVQSFGTPEAVFAAFAQAMEKDDWQSAITMITDESKQMVVTGMVMQASFMTMEDEAKGMELEQLFKKHGLDEEAAGESAGEDFDVNSLVTDLPAFVDELSAWIVANAKDTESGFPRLTEISDVKIDGDVASAVTSTEMGPQPIEFHKVDGQWKLHLATEPPPEPSIDELGLDFEATGDGQIGSMKLGERSSGLNYAFAYHAKLFDEPCIVLLLTAVEIANEQQSELEQKLKEGDGDAVFFPDGPHVNLTLSPEGKLMSMNVWIDNSSISGNRGPAVDVQIDEDTLSGRVGMAPKKFGEEMLQFQADFETEIRF